ncbi:MAG: hypothetical protein WCW64_00625 [Phycisphaerae bacterium]|jgi:hypothetical protein
MNNKNFIVYGGVEVAPSAVLRRLHTSREYGSIPDLEDSELASPDELERQAIKAELAPVLCLPAKNRNRHCSASDYSDEIGFDAFGTVDFDRGQPEFNKARYKADKLREQIKDLLITIYIIKDRIPGKAKYKILKLVRMGVIEIDDIEDWDTWQLAKLYMRAIDLRKQIAELQEASRQRRQHQYQKWLDSLG